jgi:hypothetical protein
MAEPGKTAANWPQIDRKTGYGSAVGAAARLFTRSVTPDWSDRAQK